MSSPEYEEVVEAFGAVIDYFHDRLEDEIADHTGGCSHPECEEEECSRPSTAKDYFIDARGWDEETLSEWRVGYAPSTGNVFDELLAEGFDGDALRSTGLFNVRDEPLWRGRYVFPYLDADGRPVYAIARCTGSKGGGSVGYDGHPEDYLAGKYAKVAHTKEHVPLSEPIFGLSTLEPGEDVIIAEGIADAVTAAAAGYSVLSPVTTQFKREHFEELLELIEVHDLGRAYVVPDSERAGFSAIDSDDVPPEPEHIYEAVNVPKVSPGVGGGLRTANYLAENGVDARLVELPRSGLRKVDLDDYLQEWADNLDVVLSSAKPPSQHPDYARATETQETSTEQGSLSAYDAPTSGNSAPEEYDGEYTAVESDAGRSGLWSLGVTDVNPSLTDGYRGRNPLGHVGQSENYFVVFSKGSTTIGKDYKRPGKPAYGGVTYLLVEEGERDVSAPTGPLSPEEVWVAWSTARDRGLLGPTDIIPSSALRHIAEDRSLYNFDALPDDVDELPAKAHNSALAWVLNEWWDEEEEEEQATARRYKKKDVSAVWTWEDVRYIYEKSKQKGRLAAENLLRSRHEFMTVEGTEQLQVYDKEKGIFTDKLGDVRASAHIGLGEHWSTHELNEILARLRQQNVVHPRHLNGRQHFDDPHICVKNGVLNLFSRELLPHSPEYRFTERSPVAHNPDADAGVYLEELKKWTRREEDWKAMMEMVGHALISDANERYKKFLILYGPADNGKSVFYNCVRALLEGPDGEEKNVSNVKLEKMSENRFSVDSIYGSMANIAGEIDGKKIRNTATLKDITGGDQVEIEPKGKASFFDTINSTLMFAANDPPILGERDKQAIATRIVPVEMPFRFVETPESEMEKQKEPERVLRERLMTDEAMSAFLNLALDGIERLEENNGDVSLPESKYERLKTYEKQADPMKEFGHECLENSDTDYVVKADVTTIYKEFARANGYELGSSIHDPLHRVLQGMKELSYTSSRPRDPDYSDTSLPLRPWGERKRVVDRVTLTEEGLDYARSAGLVVEEHEGTEEASAGDLANVSTGFNDLSVTIAEKLDAPDWLEGKGHVVDGAGNLLPYVCEGTDPLTGAVEGDRLEVQNVKVEDRNGVYTLVFSGVTRVENTSNQGEQPRVDEVEAAPDGGSQRDGAIEDAYGRVREHLRVNHESGDTLTAAELSGRGVVSPDSAGDVLDRLAEQGLVESQEGEGYRLL